jgi:integrase
VAEVTFRIRVGTPPGPAVINLLWGNELTTTWLNEGGLDPILKEALQALPRKGEKVFQFTAKDGHELDIKSISGRVVKLARRVGVRLTMHSLRKGFGCRYAAHVLQRLMRHGDIGTTMTYYANIDAAVEEAVTWLALTCWAWR